MKDLSGVCSAGKRDRWRLNAAGLGHEKASDAAESDQGRLDIGNHWGPSTSLYTIMHYSLL